MQPLRGLTVVSLEQAIAAPYATRQLADLGARVIKVERPGAGDFARGYDHRVNGLSSHFVWVNRNKESLTLDVKDPRGGEVLRRLLATADVFVQNLAPGATARMGLGADELQAANPRLIVCDISGYGHGGPYESMKAYDLMVQSEAGLVSVTGTPTEMAKVGISVSDIAAGMYAYSGVLAALLERGRTGRGSVRRRVHAGVHRGVDGLPALLLVPGRAARAARRRRARHHLPVRPLRRRRRQGRDDGHPERAGVGAASASASWGGPSWPTTPTTRATPTATRTATPSGRSSRVGSRSSPAPRRARCWLPSRWRTPT